MVFSQPLAFLLLVPALGVTVWAWRNGYLNLGPKRRLVAVTIRIIVLTSAVLALSGLAVRVPQGRQATVFVADLSASDVNNSGSMLSYINSALRERPNDYLAGVVTVGRAAQVEQPVSQLQGLDGFQAPVDASATNLESGLELANAILPDGYRHRIVVLSDGQQNIGDALSAAHILNAQAVRIDVVAVRSFSGPDVRVDSTDVPSQLRPNERFPLSITLYSTFNTTARLDVFLDHRLVLSRQENVHAGTNHYSFSEAPLHVGFHIFQVHSTSVGDTRPENNTGSAFTSVQGPARVLVIAGTKSEATNIVDALRSTGIGVDLNSPDEVTPTLTYLQKYAGVVIVDTAAPILGTDLTNQLVPYVRDLGRGLLVIGGQESYGLGGYGQTALEKVLPVKMDLPQRKDVPSAGVALIIESLEEPLPVNISKEAGKGIAALLTEQDQIAVNDTPNDGTSGWVVPIQPVRDKAAIDLAVAQMRPGDPNSYTPTLNAAYDALQHTSARVKHIILLGDGDALDQGYERVIRRIRAGGVTVSAVVTNAASTQDFQTMRNIAKWGGGRYYRADNPKLIPKIFLREAQTVARSGAVRGKFFPQKLSNSPMLRDLHTVPPLYGYVATAPKATGEVVLASRKLDPVLAGWQFGLGRAAAWTSDIAGLWSGDWQSSPEANRFWADVVSWTLPSSATDRLFVGASTSQGQGQISVDIPSSLGSNPNVVAHVVDPGLHAQSLQLQPSEPSHYRGAFSAPTEGSYIVSVEGSGQGHAITGQAGLNVPYSAEFRVNGTNAALLQALALGGGGSMMTQPQSAWADNLSPVFDERSLVDLLWLVALLLLPVDIAVRRLLLRKRDLEAIRAALPFLHPRSAGLPVGVAVHATRGLRQSLEPAAGRHVTQARTRAASFARSPAGSKAHGLQVADEPKRDVEPDELEVTDGMATVSQLLAAKRRRQ